ncbi:hypothetical protein SAMN05444955_11947 [Lihuaxuella thermophila]|uniref:DUF4158 domain-containing protein n=1 Tax=Lihuaxuella thermophila TaxID=1173111 RepID=A0A1H8ITK0_9BACL|nr:hypothetical protein SAMN05444955_11947 [Lihuaxuella thermophila]
MKQQWSNEELINYFILLEPEKQLIEAKYVKSQLGFAVLFKYFQHTWTLARCMVAYDRILHKDQF